MLSWRILENKWEKEKEGRERESTELSFSFLLPFFVLFVCLICQTTDELKVRNCVNLDGIVPEMLRFRSFTDVLGQ